MSSGGGGGGGGATCLRANLQLPKIQLLSLLSVYY